MIFRIGIQRNSESGEYEARTLERFDCRSTGPTSEEALTNLRDEIRYRVEISACAWVNDDYVQLKIEESR